MNPLTYCRDQAAPAGSAHHYATLFLPEAHKPAALAVLALRKELENAVTRIAEPSVAQARLDWWLAELESAANGKAQHPVAQALLEHVLLHPDRLALLQEMVAGAQDRLRHGHLEDERAFGLFAWRNDIAPWLILTDPESTGGRAERDLAHAVGQALAWVRVLHHLGRDVAQGQVLIPLDTLARQGVEHGDLMHPRTTDAVRAMLAALGGQTLERIRQARALIPGEARPGQIMALVSLAHAEALLEAMRQEDWRLLEQRPELTPLRLLWIGWRSARKARKGGR
ncbi:MAG: hypothetical protein FNT29_10575 [Halothiobacillaceae bacterium]|nr:MAG: hypothetical protein FNT29_10575 [Halothiobacillaceae bacterium]